MADMEVCASIVQKRLCLFYRRKEATPRELGSSCRAMCGASNCSPACNAAAFCKPTGAGRKSPGRVLAVSESAGAVRICQAPGPGAVLVVTPRRGCRPSPGGVGVSLRAHGYRSAGAGSAARPPRLRRATCCPPRRPAQPLATPGRRRPPPHPLHRQGHRAFP